MVKLKAFSRLKNIFSRLNPIPSFKWDDSEEEIIVPPSSEELLEMVIKKYPLFKNAILIAIYHLINTQNVKTEYLTVLTKNHLLIADLIKGKDDNVSTPSNVKSESEKNNILIACHNHYFGAVIPSLGDICSAIKNNCQFIAIVSDNRIGFLIFEYKSKNHNQLIADLELFNCYIDMCFDFEKGGEVDKLYNMNISKSERKKLRLKIYDKFISENNLKFVNEFNVRFNKYNIYEIYRTVRRFSLNV